MNCNDSNYYPEDDDKLGDNTCKECGDCSGDKDYCSEACWIASNN